MKTYTLTWTNMSTGEQNSNLLTVEDEPRWPDIMPRRPATEQEAKKLLKIANTSELYKNAVHSLRVNEI
jgi:hypothetical protein